MLLFHSPLFLIIIPPPTHSPVAVTVEGQLSVPMNGGVGSPAKSVFDPYDTTSLHIFIREEFPGAVLLEEHQV